MKQKWIEEGGIFFPISGNVVLHSTPGPGIWKVHQGQGMDKRLGLVKISDKFEFDYKIYDTGGEAIKTRVKDLWNNENFEKTGKNLGIILNGAKGTGKTICAKLLCNELEQPVIIVDNGFEGAILDFICSLEFECTIFLDEAEKTFTDEDGGSTCLLKLIDGIYNRARKLYVLTTNKLSVNENLLGRPGRIRYVQEFNNLPPATIENIVEDLLIDKSKKEEIFQTIELLDMATIDIIKSIIEEVNIMGTIDENTPLNIPKASHVFEALCMYNITETAEQTVIEMLSKCPEDKDMITWIRNTVESDSENNEFMEKLRPLGCEYLYVRRVTASSSLLYSGCHCSLGSRIIYDLDDNGFFVAEDYDKDPILALVLQKKKTSGLYRGKLADIY